VEAVKPLLPEGISLVLSDDMVAVGNRVYVKARASLIHDESKEELVGANGFAKEAESKKGMDDAQITGAASSYARKYALSGLFAIDDTKDADATNKHEDKQPKKEPLIKKGDNILDDTARREALASYVVAFKQSLVSCKSGGDVDALIEVSEKYLKKMKKDYPDDYEALMDTCENRKIEISEEYPFA
jgi:hypothetical protein